MPDDETPNEDERQQAEVLAGALERGHAETGAPQGALEAGHLIRYSRDGGELGAERSEAILADVLERARPPAPAGARRRWRRWWIVWGAVGAAAGLAGAVALWAGVPRPPSAALPRPPERLLRAQMSAAAEGRPQRVDELETRMRAYRITVYDALEARYRR